jgi:hypothetical protein
MARNAMRLEVEDGDAVSSWLIDDSGDARLEGTVEFEHQLRSPPPTSAASGFLLRNAGFVRLSMKARVAAVECSREHFDPCALIGLLHLLSDIKPAAVTITYVEADFPIHIFRRRRAWIDFIGALVDARTTKAIRTERQIPLSMSVFNLRCAAASEIVRSVIDAAARDRILDELFQGMFTLTRMDTETGAFCIAAVGSEINRYDEFIREAGIGRSIQEVSLCTYGTWVMDHYQKVVKAKEPCADDVDATILWRGSTSRLHRYSRLTIPIEKYNLGLWVLSVSSKRRA